MRIFGLLFVGTVFGMFVSAVLARAGWELQRPPDDLAPAEVEMTSWLFWYYLLWTLSWVTAVTAAVWLSRSAWRARLDSPSGDCESAAVIFGIIAVILAVMAVVDFGKFVKVIVAPKLCLAKPVEVRVQG